MPEYCEFVFEGDAATCRHCGRRVERVKSRKIHAYCRRIMGGAGTELKALLGSLGISATPNCSCNRRVQLMNERGCDWCESHIDTIDKWMAEEAKKRKLPYFSLAGKALIRMAIRRARKKGNG